MAAGTDWAPHRAGAAAADRPGSGADRAGTGADRDRRGPGWPRAMATTSLVRTDAAADRATDGSDRRHPRWVASDIVAAAAVAAAGMEYTGCCRGAVAVALLGVGGLLRSWAVVLADREEEDPRRKVVVVVVRWDLRADRFPARRADLLLAGEVAAVDLEEPDSRRRPQDSGREDREAGRVTGRVRYCPVAAVDTAAIRADCRAAVAVPSPVDVHRTEAVPAAAAAVHRATHSADPVALGPAAAVLPEVAARVVQHSGRNCSGSGAAGDVAAVDGTGAGSLGSEFARVVRLVG